MAAQVALQLVTLFYFMTGVSGWRCAKYENYFSQQPDYIDCLWDCCGNSFNRHCCAPIGIIVGCCIVGAIVVAALTVLLICWWQRRRAKQSQGPRLFHNQRHSHYPVAPSSVTRPAPVMAYIGSDSDQEFKQPPENEYGAPPRTGYKPGPPQGYRASPRLEKPPLDEYYNDRPPQSYRPGPPRQQYPPSVNSEKVSLGSHSGERAVDI
ncbi:hypothetical protein BsWGS_11701 [Bradybaena similaris]